MIGIVCACTVSLVKIKELNIGDKMERYKKREKNNKYYNFYHLEEDEKVLEFIENIKNSELIISSVNVYEDVERDMKNGIEGAYGSIEKLLSNYDYIESFASKFNDVTVSIHGEYNLDTIMIQFYLGTNAAGLVTSDPNLDLSKFTPKS